MSLQPRTRCGRLLVAVLGLGLLLASSAIARAEPTEAAWVDSEHAITTVQALPRPAVAGACTGGLTSFTATWSAPAGTSATNPAPIGYTVTVRNAANSPVSGTPTDVTATSYTTGTLLGSVGGTSYTFTVVARYANGWTSTAIAGDAQVFLLGLAASCTWRP